MKKTAFFVAAGLILAVFTSSAQTDTTKQVGYATVKTKTLLPMPEPVTIEKIFPVLGTYQSTQSNIEGAGNVTITLDPDNKGLVWIEGLPVGKIKAMLRKAPATYKIPSQKTEDGKLIDEGTLVFDNDANVLNVCLGCNYNDMDPGQPFTVTTSTDVNASTMDVTNAEPKTKTKTTATKVKNKTKTPKVKVWTYTGSKINSSAATNNQ